MPWEGSCAVCPKPRAGIACLTSPGFIVVATSFSTAAQKYLPTISFLMNYAQAGMLMTYGPIQKACFPRAAILADKILRGAGPGDLTIEGPGRFELAII